MQSRVEDVGASLKMDGFGLSLSNPAGSPALHTGHPVTTTNPKSRHQRFDLPSKGLFCRLKTKGACRQEECLINSIPK